MKCNSKHFRWGKGSHADDPRPGDVTTLQMDTKVKDWRLKVTIMCKNHAFPPPPSSPGRLQGPFLLFRCSRSIPAFICATRHLYSISATIKSS